ncbi:MAG: hypothetical protein NTW10_08620 [Bacteroidetes bacterium]|nr:hypothetical protein [Bacteroidota bacterium]
MLKRVTFTITLFLLLLVLHGYSQPTITTSNDTTICLGGTAVLTATVTGGSYGTSSYTFETIPYNPQPFSGGTAIDPIFTVCGGGSPHDDCYGGPYPIGFSFCFLNKTYTQFYVGSNGWIGFSAPQSGWTTFNAQTLPCSDPSCPKNCIFSPWQDWQPDGLAPGNHIFYYTTGTSPTQKLVVYWLNCPMFGCTSGIGLHPLGTFQIVINEQNSIIENNIQNKPYCANNGNKATQGVQDSTGTIAFIATGRNQSNWTAGNESTRFNPSGITWYTGGFPGGTVAGYGTPINFSPAVTTTYTAVVQVCDGSFATGNVKVSVINAEFSYPKNTYCQSDPNPTPTVEIPTGTFTAVPAGIVFTNPNTGTIDLAASAPGNYTITYTITNPCTVALSKPMTINGTPAKPVPLASYVSRCGPGQVTFAVVQPPLVTIHWYDAPVGGNLLPFPGAIVTTNVLTTTHFYAEAQTNGSPCTSLSRTDILVVIKPVPVITNNVLNFTICSGDSLRIILASTIPASTFQWKASTKDVTLTGYFDGTGGRIAQKLLNSGPVNDTVIYSVAATADTCTSDTVKFVVAVQPFFDIFVAPLAQTICSNTLITINLTSSNPAANFSWTATRNYAGLSGYANGIGNTISQTLLNSGPLNGTVTYKIVPQGLGCTGDTVVATVLVHPLPAPSIAGLALLCAGSSGIVYTTQPGMSNYLWTVSGGGSISGGGGTGNNSVTVTWNTPGAESVSVNYHDANGCTAAAPVVYPVTVNPVPGVPGIISGSAVLCQGSSGITYSVAAVPSAISYLWTLVPAAAGTITGNSASVILDWAAGYAGGASLMVQGVNNCGNGPTSPVLTILVNPKPVVNITPCTDTITIPAGKIIQLREGIPLGGTWSGPGVNSLTGTFNPAIAGLGTHAIFYSYSNVNACANSAFQNITVVNPGIFNCGGSLKDVRDNIFYATVQIGTQCWMAVNLNFGSQVPSTSMQRDNCTSEKFCFGDNPANCTSNGGLYQWDELMKFDGTEGVQGLCPPGWHVPSENEWTTLFNFYTGNGFAASPLKSTGYSGFNAILPGIRFDNVNWNFNNFATFFWSSTRQGTSKAWAHSMNTENPSVSYYPGNRSNAFSVRCIKD